MTTAFICTLPQPLSQEIVHLVPAKLFLEGWDRGILVDEQKLHACDLGEVFQMFGCQRLAETSMMRPSCQDPGGSGRLQVGLRPPYGPGDRKPGQGLMRRYHLYCIDEHAEAITHILYCGIDGRARHGINHHTQ